MEKGKILLAEDDFYFAHVLKKHLEAENYDVTLCADGELAWRAFQKSKFHICLLDVQMPKKTGLELAKLIRSKSEIIPIIFLSTKSADEDRIRGFKHGGDDYLPKPFNIQELLARIQVFLKRSTNPDAAQPTTYSIGDTTLDLERLVLIDKDGRLISRVTEKEALLLRFFAANPNKILKREEILYHVWGKDDYYLGRSLDVFMTKIRKELKYDKKIFIETLHGIGFRFHIGDQIKKWI